MWCTKTTRTFIQKHTFHNRRQHSISVPFYYNIKSLLVQKEEEKKNDRFGFSLRTFSCSLPRSTIKVLLHRHDSAPHEFSSNDLLPRGFSTTSSEDVPRQLKKIRKRGAKLGRKAALSFKEVVQKYGAYFAFTYFTIYVTTVSAFFVAIEFSVLDPLWILDWDFFGDGSTEAGAATASDKIASVLDKYEMTQSLSKYVESSPQATNLGVAWLCAKVTEPLRLAVALPITRMVARVIRGKDDEDDEEEEEEENVVSEGEKILDEEKTKNVRV